MPGKDQTLRELVTAANDLLQKTGPSVDLAASLDAEFPDNEGMCAFYALQHAGTQIGSVANRTYHRGVMRFVASASLFFEMPYAKRFIDIYFQTKEDLSQPKQKA